MRLLAGLADLAEAYDGFIIDLWGVIHDGATLYPGAGEALAELTRRGKKTLMLSNAPRRARALVELMTALNVPRAAYGEVMSSGEAVYREMVEKSDPWFARLGRRCYHLGPPRDLPLFTGLDLDLVPRVEDADFIMNTGFDGPDDTLARHEPLLERAATMGRPMICANPDLVVVNEGRPVLCAGILARRYRELGGDVAYRGKPDPVIYDRCLDLLGLTDRRRVLAVGDSFETDMAGARAAGLDGLLIAGGIHAKELGIAPGGMPNAAAVEAAAAVYGGHRPTVVVPRFAW